MTDRRLDAEIDEVAREMTRGGELPPHFRASVIARLESDERPWTLRPAWLLSSIAVAAVVLVAVLVVRAPWRSGVRVAPGEVRQNPALSARPSTSSGRAVEGLDRTNAGIPPSGSYVGSESGRTASAELTSVIALYVASGFSRTTEQSVASDLTPAPIALESLDVEAMESVEIAPLSVDAMESIDVPRMDVAPQEVPVIAE